jgi:hypothetical protein
MRHLVLLAGLALGAGCGGSSPSSDTCIVTTSAGPVPVVSAQSCAAFTEAVAADVEEYQQWHTVRLAGWTVEIVPAGSIGGNHGGMTYFADRLVQVEGQGVGLRVLVHELEHVRLGPDSENHCDWNDFASWELAETGLDEFSYDAASCAQASGER